MADLKKTIEIVFKGDDTLLSSTVGGVIKTFRQFDDLADPFAKIGEGVLKADAALAALVAGGLYYALKKSIEYENATIELRKVLGDVPDKIAEVQRASKALSIEYGESASSILTSTADFIQAGFNTREAMQLTKSAMDLVIAGNIPAADSANYLISVLKGFKAPAEDVTRVVDILNEISNKYATNVQELAIGMGDLSPIARTMGFSLEETAGLVTPVIEIFRSGSESAQALKTGLLKLIDDSKPVRDALASIGVSQHDANGEMRSGRDILYDVQKAFVGLDEPQKLFLTQQLVGIQQSARMVEVFDALSKTTEITATAMESAGSAQAEVAERLASSEVQIKRYKVSLDNLATTIGDKFKAAALNVVAGGVEINKALDKIASDEAFHPIYEAFESAGDRIGGIMKEIAENLEGSFSDVDWSKLLEAIEEFFDELFDVDISKPRDLSEVIQFIADSIASLINTSRGIGEVFGLIGKTIVTLISEFNKLDSSTQKLLGNMAGMGMAYKMFGPLSLAIVALGMDTEDAGKIFAFVVASIENGVNAVKIGVIALALAFANAAQSAAEMLDYIPGYNAQEGIERTTERVKVLEQELDKAWAAADKSTQKWWGVFDGTATAVDDVKDRFADFDEQADEIFGKQREVAIGAKVDEASVEKATGDLKDIPKNAFGDQEYQDGQVHYIVGTSVDPDSKKTTIDDLDDVKAKADVLKTAFEWNAKLEIAQVEGQVKVVESMFDSIDNAIKSSGDLLSDLWGAMAGGDLDIGEKWDLEKQIEAENKRRQEQHELQKKLIEQQLELNEIKLDMLRSGDALINISADGLEPELEAFMWKILERVQMRATEEGAEFLLGI